MKHLGYHFFLGLQGTQLQAAEVDWIQKQGVGGIIFYRRNFESIKQFKQLSQDIRQVAQESPLRVKPFFCIDMEGGRIQELPAQLFAQFPHPFEWLGKNPENDLYRYGLDVATYLRQLGFHINFAPCLDVITDSHNLLMQGRTLGDSVEQVLVRATDLVQGYHEGGLLTCGKHFPGHGNTNKDSHYDLPFDDRSEADIMAYAVEPFKVMVSQSIALSMSAHVMYPSIDPDYPATLSARFMQTILREYLGYQGLCLADDLDMGALTKQWSPQFIAERFLKVGGDILMYSHREQPPFDILEHLQSQLDPITKSRLSHSFQHLLKELMVAQ